MSTRKAYTTSRSSHAQVLLTSIAEELSEEDQNLKNELEMLVARLHVCLEKYYLVLLQLA